jgi:hypothetical protein
LPDQPAVEVVVALLAQAVGPGPAGDRAEGLIGQISDQGGAVEVDLGEAALGVVVVAELRAVY